MIGVSEVALPAIPETPTTGHTSFAFLLDATTAIAAVAISTRVQDPELFQGGSEGRTRGGGISGRSQAYARTARLRFSSETRGRFCWPRPAGVVGPTSMAVRDQGGRWRGRRIVGLWRGHPEEEGRGSTRSGGCGGQENFPEFERRRSSLSTFHLPLIRIRSGAAREADRHSGPRGDRGLILSTDYWVASWFLVAGINARVRFGGIRCPSDGIFAGLAVLACHG